MKMTQYNFLRDNSSNESSDNKFVKFQKKGQSGWVG